MIALDGFKVEGLPTSRPAESTVALQMGRDDDDHMDWDGGSWVMVSMMGIFWLAILVLAAWGIATYARNSGRREDSALETVRRRYARGEINAEEFERIKRDLG